MPRKAAARLTMKRTSTYRFEDFVAQLRRTPSQNISRLYVENQPLFEGREDLLQRCILSLSWEKSMTMFSTAVRHQSVAVMTYRVALTRLLSHNAAVVHAQAAGVATRVAPAVPWYVALRILSEALANHGMATHSRVLRSSVKLMAPSRRWAEAIRICQFAEAQQQSLTPRMLIDAAAACATSATWVAGMRLLSHAHRANPELLLDAISSIPLPNTDAAHAVVASPKRSPADQAILDVVGAVVGSCPPRVLLTNEFCLSYLSHLLKSPWYRTSARLEEATRRLSWDDAVRVFQRAGLLEPKQQRTLGDGLRGLDRDGVRSLPGEPTTSQCSVSGVTQRMVAAGTSSPTDAVASAAVLVSSILARMPSLAVIEDFLTHRLALDKSVLTHHAVATSKALHALRERDWKSALQVLAQSSAAPVVSLAPQTSHHTSAMYGTLVDVMYDAMAVGPFVTRALPLMVPAAITFDQRRLAKLLRMILAFNDATCANTARQVPWEAALGWAVNFARRPVAAAAANEPSVRTADPTPRPFPRTDVGSALLSANVTSVLVHLCVCGGCPQAALRVLTHFRKHSGGLQLQHQEILRALLFCMIYRRSLEAQLLIRQATRKHGAASVRPIQALMKRWREGADVRKLV